VSPAGSSARRARQPTGIFVALRIRRATFAGVLLTCQAGFETLLARELAELHGLAVREQGPGWVLAAPNAAIPPAPFTAERCADCAFAHVSLPQPVELHGESVNALAGKIADLFLTGVRGERIDTTWPSVWLGPAELVGLGRRIDAVRTACGGTLRKRLSRVARLATPELPRTRGPVRGLFVFFAGFGRAFVSREAFVHGPRRMADDSLAPSRSYLKVEEAYVVLGHEPQAGETVCDLGAAPGGWSFSAAKRGALVIAVDNGPLKGGALDHPRIEHRREDAFRFSPAAAERTTFDWLFCDMVEEPHHVLRDVVEPWLARRWCRHFVVNLKFGRVDPIALLRELRAPSSPLSTAAPHARIVHLYHDREEFTVVGTLTA
jgi:23S rRNA (cytidine2498-2'-O)-methyltransferase